MKAILKVISLYNERFTIEAEEMFKIGVRTGRNVSKCDGKNRKIIVGG